ncbi:dimethylhistidine N-methyltransferase [Rhodothalassium salexigens DSM 2132]|uniref:Dimethylhistidine N-methyltransferase n=1 Tax=Rhodothalassium salexigens DSM 2132 TaxID=1188247 RepID=A0A4R2PQD4_RHOSA|nr:L-histidine N(alpha)-methyltransferase [Rhodothalassium salexigens]MBB4210546.1 dimethylhistidine N-methyltransferase [Rhodothalassium salexigens DSM 2132]MBK1638045.1 L-histidine N(alpha)-methyltransferase [Rhodothalassium salexigens DSM 2132]TCP37897.1 dimethylhistidine N-methyltransferase [Rhodothalassium salexigens DSM 2132]
MSQKTDATGLRFFDMAPPVEDMKSAVLDGLTATPKGLSPSLLYDQEGSRIFEAICDQPEYYPTRTEIGILRAAAPEIAAAAGPDVQVVEFGAGALEKVGLLIDALARPAGIAALDISGDHLLAAARDLAHAYPGLDVVAIAADYHKDFDIPAPVAGPPRRRLGFFPGSTIGNFAPDAAVDFLTNARRLLGRDGLMVLGVDLRKDPRILEAAYDDAAGVTAAFNLNLLTRLNRDLGADFEPGRFRHKALYNQDLHRVEMHLESLADQRVQVAGQTIAFAAGETIHTENSHKHTIETAQALAADAGFTPQRVWTDDQDRFSVHLLAA